MKHLIFLLLFTFSIFGQNSESISDQELCGQIQSAIEYLKADKELKTQNFRFDSKIGNGWNYNNYFLTEYTAFQLKTEKEKVYEYDKTKIYPIFKKLNFPKNESELKLDCIKRSRRPNVRLSKLEKENLLLEASTDRVGKEGSSGTTYLFFFDNNKIIKVYKSSWIE